MNKSQNNYAEFKNQIKKEYILYDSTNIKF